MNPSNTDGRTDRILTFTLNQGQFNLLCFLLGMANAAIHERNNRELLDDSLKLLDHLIRSSEEATR